MTATQIDLLKSLRHVLGRIEQFSDRPEIFLDQLLRESVQLSQAFGHSPASQGAAFMGSVSSPAKAASSRSNGARGGRPCK